MADFATLSLLKDLIDGWDEEATRLEKEVYLTRAPDCATREEARAEQLRECIAELGVLFPAVKAWHEKGEVPAATDLEPLVRQLVEDWRAGTIDGSRAMHDLWVAITEGKLPA